MPSNKVTTLTAVSEAGRRTDCVYANIKVMNLNVCNNFLLAQNWILHTERQHNQHNQHTNADKKVLSVPQCTLCTHSLNSAVSLCYHYVSYNLFYSILYCMFEMLSLVIRLLRAAHLMGCLFVSTFQIENTIKFNTMLFYAFSAEHNKRAL